MSRWRELIDNLLADLETETPGAKGFRVNIDHKIWQEARALLENPWLRVPRT